MRVQLSRENPFSAELIAFSMQFSRGRGLRANSSSLGKPSTYGYQPDEILLANMQTQE
jgi:hypothetical protein